MMSGAVLFASVFGFVVTSELALRILEPSFVSSAPESRDLPGRCVVLRDVPTRTQARRALMGGRAREKSISASF